MKRNKSIVSDKRRRKNTVQYLAGGGNSNYARKKAYCHKHGVWGFEVQNPKPWKKSLI